MITAASRVFRIMDETEEVPAQLNDPEQKSHALKLSLKMFRLLMKVGVTFLKILALRLNQDKRWRLLAILGAGKVPLSI